jgi:hypothetical protein
MTPALFGVLDAIRRKKATIPEEHRALLRVGARDMLGKPMPDTRSDWVAVMNYLAWNLEYEHCPQACRAIARHFKAPLTEKEVDTIVDFQTYDRAMRELVNRSTGHK